MKTMRSTLAALALGLASLAALAAPTPEAVQDAIRAQNWTQAQSMLTEVTKEKPNSAKAWYYLAQTEDKLGHPSAAKADLLRSETLQPDLKFASPGAVKSLEARLDQQMAVALPRATTTTQYQPAYAPAHADSGMAIFWILGIVLVCGLGIWAIHRAFFRPAVYIGQNGNQAVGFGGGGYAGPAYGGGGSTVVVNGGSNSSGLVEGMIIGNMLSDHHHDHYRDDGYSTPSHAPAPSSWDNTPAPSPSSFDLGGGSSSSWDSGSSSSGGFDGGSSSGGSDW